ncbi:11S globulin seed storage protein 1-like [Rhododendron vialii]|uniref:11S globulin seed storage protein 1-like n=1 Tax=Rhododendron vialii TaxID=182163 RepID=UPI00265EC661|nr:11S globulin seed storage protein 1-like [Rhododendron vialii]
MASHSLHSLALCFLFLSHGCFSQLLEQQQQQLRWHELRGAQQHRLRAKTDCQIQRINALEPDHRIEAEAGLTEIWDQNNNEELQCAGVAAVRHQIQPRGLLLPSYTNVPQIYYVIQGRGIQGTVISGCAETFESVSQTGGGREGGQRPRDRHQKIRQIRQGDVIALPAGVAHWAYNNGETPLVFVSLLDLANDANQLDLNFRKIYLAGNPLRRPQGGGRHEQEQHRRHSQAENAGNVFSGFDDQTLADIFNVDTETARRLQGQDDRRGNIVRVEREFGVISPQYQGEEEEREREERRRGNNGTTNGLEETLCTFRLKENIGDPSKADVYNPRGGRVSTLNSQNLPVLGWVRLSAERGVLYRDGLMAPLWNINAHSIIYILQGSGRLQIVGNSDNSAFDNHVREGQLIVVPQNFAVIKKASDQGLEWISFKTNGNAMTSQLAGRLSAIRNIPEEVLMNSYDISRDEARSLKYNREEVTVFGPGSRSQREREA